MTTPSSLAKTLVSLTDEKMRQYGMRVMTPAVKIQELLKTFESLNWSIIEIEEFQSEVRRLGNSDVTKWTGEAVSQWKARHVEDIEGYTIDDTLAHELGHVIAHIDFSIPFDYVWVRGISKDDWIDKYYGERDPESAGCVGTYYHNPDKTRMAFDGVKIKRVKGDGVTANEYVTILLSGCAGSEILRGFESPRSVIEIQKTYYGMSRDVTMAAGWVKQGVEDGYFHADEVWRVLQHYYIEAFDIVRDHKAFLLEAMKLLGKTGWLSADAVMTLWNKFYRVEPQEKVKKETRLSIRDNAETITLTDLKGEPMKFTEHEIFVLHNTAARQAKREAGADAQNLWSPATTMGNRFAYVDGRRYDTYGMRDGIPYFLQRMGLMTVDKKGTTTATIPDGILPPVAPLSIWAKDLLTVTERFAKSLDDVGSNPRVYLNPWEFIHLTENYPAPQDIVERVKTIRTLVQDIAVLDRELATAQQENDLLCRPVAGLTRHDDIKLRFLLELSLPALKAAVTRVKNDYDAAKPENYDKMKKREQEKCDWVSSSATMLGKYVEKVAEGQQLTFDELATVRYYLTATAAHAGWRIEAARRHPDQGGSVEASSVFSEIWDRLEKMLPMSCNEAAQAVAGAR